MGGEGAETKRLSSAAPVAEVDRATFERRPGTQRLGDVVTRMPGIYMGGPPGLTQDIRVRGLDQEFSRLEMGGIQLPGNGVSRAVQAHRLSSYSVGSISLLRNPTPEYESDGIGGRVLAEYRQIPDSLRMEADAWAGGVSGNDRVAMDELYGLRANVGDRVNGLFGYNLFVDAQRYPMENNIRKRTYTENGTLSKDENDRHFMCNDTFNASADLAWFGASDEVHLRPVMSLLDSESHRELYRITAGKADETDVTDENNRSGIYGVSLSDVHALDADARIESDAAYFLSDASKDNIKATSKKGKNGAFAIDKTTVEETDEDESFWQVRSKWIKPFIWGLPQEVRLGGAIRGRSHSRSKDTVEIKANGTVTDKGMASDDFDLNEAYYAAFLQDTIFLTERFSLTPGVRAEHVRTDATSDGSGESEDDARTDLNPALHALFRMTDNSSVHAAVSRTINRPSFDQLVPFSENKTTYYREGNPELEPAESWNYDLSVEHCWKHLFIGYGVFHKDIKNVIEETLVGTDAASGLDLYRFENTGDGWLRGIELEQRLDLVLLDDSLKGFELWSNQAFLDSRLKVVGAEGSRPFNNQPDVIIHGGAAYTFEPTHTTLGVAVGYVGSFTEEVTAQTRKIRESRGTLDLEVRQRIARRWEVYAQFLNVTDSGQERRTYTDGSLTLSDDAFAGRTLLVGMRAQF